MRRSQFDCGSQPVTNLFTNPSFETAGGTITTYTNVAQNPSFETTSGTVDVRTNLFTNPAFEATTGTTDVRANLAANPSFEATTGTITVRTNLAANPAMEAITTNQAVRTNLAVNPKMTNYNFGGYGAQTLSTISGVTGNPELITTAVRSAYVASAGNPGVIVMPLPDVSTQYTVSAWVYNEGSVVENIAIALKGSSSGGSQSVQPGVWTRLSWTMTTPAALGSGNDFGIRIGTPSADGSFLTTGVLIEKAPILGTYFDGTTPAYDNLAKTATTALSGVTITTGIAYSGATWSRAAVATGTGAWIARQYVALTDLVNGETYTASVTVANDTATATNIAMDWCDINNGSYTIQPGETRRIKVTGLKATYDTVYRFSDLQVNQDATGPRSILFKDWTIERGTTDGKYFAGTGDFTYAWSGAVNASASLQQAPSLGTWAGQAIGASRVYQTTRDAISGKSAAIYKSGGYVFLNVSLTGLQASTSYTFSYDVISPVATVNTVDRGVAGGAYSPQDKTVTPGTLTRLSRTFVTGAGETTRLVSLAGWETATAPDGSLMVVDNMLIELSTLTQGYFDGATAAAGDFTYVWAGTANASVSYMQAPGIATWLNRWFGSTGGAGVLYQAKGGISGTYARKQWNVANTGATMDAGINTPLTAASGNISYTLSAWVRCSVAQNFNFYIEWKDVGGAVIGSTGTSAFTAVAANTWTRVSVTGISPAATTGATFVVGPYATALPMPAGSTMDFDCVLAEATSTVKDYFDGSYPIQNLCSNPSFESTLGTWNQVSGGAISRDTTQGYVGTSCAKITVANTVDGAYFAGGAGTVIGGTTVTTSAYVKVPVGMAFRFDTDTSPDGVSWAVSNTSTYVATGNWQRVSHTTVMPAGTTKVAVGFKSNAVWSGSILVDAILIENGTSLNPYYEGTDGFTYVWAGTAHASRSVQQAPKLAAVGDANQAIAYRVGASTGNYRGRILFTNNTIGDSGINFSGGITTGFSKTYTVSVVLTSPINRSIKFSAQGAGVVAQNSANISLTAGVPSRQVWSFTTQASGTYAIYILRNDMLVETLDIDHMVIEEGPSQAGGYFDGSRVDLNLAPASNFETDTTGWWPNTGTPTITASTDRAFLGTKSLKAVSTLTSTDIAVTFTVALKTSTVYTLSYWVYSPDARSSCYFDVAATNFNASRAGERAVTANTWTKISATFMTSDNLIGGAAFYLHNGGGPSAIGSMVYLDAVLLEESNVANQFYEGAGDFTYAWTGTAHASASVQRGVAVSRVSSERAYGISTTRSGDKVVRIIPAVKGAGQAPYAGPDVFVNLFSQPASLKANTTYTVMVNYQNEAPLSAGGKLRFNVDTDQSSAAFNTAVGDYTMYWTFTTGANVSIAFMRFMPGPSGVDGYPNEVLLKRLMIVEGAYTGPYFDGTTSASTDYTYAWSGTAHSSASIQRASSVVGLTQTYYSQPITSSEWSATGTKSLRITPTSSSMSESFTSIIGTFGSLGSLAPGRTYTVLATLRLAAPLTGTLYARALQIVWRQDTARLVSTQGANVAGVQKLRLTFTVGANATSGFIEFFNGAFVGGGDVWWDDIMVVEGTYTGDYVDGTKPLSKWTGTANASASLGYPQQLLDIAGAPSLQQIGSGNSANPVVNGFAARTLYLVYETTNDNSTSWQVPFMYGSNAPTDGFTVQTAAAGNFTMSPRMDFVSGGGDVNKGHNFPNGRSLARRHILAVSFNQGLTSYTSYGNGSLLNTAVLNPGTVGWTSGQLRNFTQGNIKGLHTMAYYAEHDGATKLAISRYLANKYGANVA